MHVGKVSLGFIRLIFYLKGFYWNYLKQMVINVKEKRFKRGRSPSLHPTKAGDFKRKDSAAFFSSCNTQIMVGIS